MRYLALAVDYDGTLAREGHVHEDSLQWLRQLAETGRKLILVTGRELDELLGIFPGIEIFDLVVAENGALLYRPNSRERHQLGEAPPEAFVEALYRRAITPLSVGKSIVATVHPNETIVLEVIRDLGLELQVIFNKGAVMVLPANVNKASGLMAALEELSLSPHNVVGIGDGENDHALLGLCEYSVAVANAIAMLKAAADRTTVYENGNGVVEVIRDLIDNDLRKPVPARRHVLLGRNEQDEELLVPTACVNVLVAGTSGSGKSTLASGLLERLAELKYQFCVIDPEGDYEDFSTGIVFGSADHAPSASEVMTALEKPETNAIVNLIGLPLQDRPAYFLSLLSHLQELRAKTGRPHWILVDETHHLLPAEWEPASQVLAQELHSMIYVTVHPEEISLPVLQGVDIFAALGQQPELTLEHFCDASGRTAPPMQPMTLEAGEALVWLGTQPPFKLRVEKSQGERRRHSRKYAEGELPPDRSFYFRGSEGKLNLRAQNLILFIQLAEGVDDDTWMYHLREGHYSEWMRTCVKDETLADQVQQVEADDSVSPQDSRLRVKAAIEQHYTLPASKATDSSSKRGA